MLLCNRSVLAVADCLAKSAHSDDMVLKTLWGPPDYCLDQLCNDSCGIVDNSSAQLD